MKFTGNIPLKGTFCSQIRHCYSCHEHFDMN